MFGSMTIGKKIFAVVGLVIFFLIVVALSAIFGLDSVVGSLQQSKQNAEEVIQGNKLDSTMAQREVDHLNWANTLNSLLTNDKIESLDQLVKEHNFQTDHTKCGFGKWLYGEGRKDAEKLLAHNGQPSSEFNNLVTSIEKPHKHLHESAKAIGAEYEQPTPGLIRTLNERLLDHVSWVATVSDRLATEAGGIYLYHSTLKNGVEQVETVVDMHYKEAQTNPGIAKEIKTEVLDIVQAMRYGPSGKDYFFIFDTNGICLMHPTSPNLVGKNVLDVQDQKGQYIFKEMLKIATSKGEGELLYYWMDPSTNKITPKLTYVHLFKPWGWVIGTGVYLDIENDALIARAESAAAGEPFSLAVQTDPNKCGFGKWLNSPALRAITEDPHYAEFATLIKAIHKPHNELHASAIEIEKLVNQQEMIKAQRVFQTDTQSALGKVKDTFSQLMSIEEAKDQASKKANQIYATDTTGALHEVQHTLGEIRATVKKSIMTEDIMLQAVEDGANAGTRTEWIVGILSFIAFMLGVIISIVIGKGIVRSLAILVENLSNGADQVAAASNQISSASQQLAEGATEQAASLEETSSALEEMASMTRQSADNSASADQDMSQTKSLVDKGAVSVSNMAGAMTDINESADKISNIIKTIEEIAFQTNLLALNAAVEAARAGEAGKGFAVVADEVRNLAQRAGQAARDTASLIEGTVTRVRTGSEIVTELETSFADIETGANKVAALVSQISNASSEQAQGIDQVNTAVAQMDKVTQSNAANSEESASASEELHAQAEALRGAVQDLAQMSGVNITHHSAVRGARATPPKQLSHGNASSRSKGPRVASPNDVIPFDDDF